MVVSNDVNSILWKGADERIFLNENGLTKYGLSLIEDNIVNRGSLMQETLLTCSSENEWIALRGKIAEELKSNIGNKNRSSFEIFFAPSGTDLLYFPLIFSRLLYPQKNILNILTCIEELGSGTELASEGKYYADLNQFGARIVKGAPILLDSPIKTIFLRARSKNGIIMNHESKIESLIREHRDYSIIVNLVYGSKSGIEDNLKLIDYIKADNIIWNTDICQFRHSKRIINMLLNKNATIMLTGSKFYQSPPFCGAMLVPNSLYKKIHRANNWETFKSYSSIFSRFDFPLEMFEKLSFSKEFNIPLTLRWLCAIEEIKKYNKISEDITEQKIKLWRKIIVERMQQIPEFELMPNQKDTNGTIISFRLKVDKNYMNHEDLKKIFHSVVTTDHSSNYGFKRLFIGQPVSYQNQSFLRLAIGAKNIREFVESNEVDFELDKSILTIIRDHLFSYYENNK